MGKVTALATARDDHEDYDDYELPTIPTEEEMIKRAKKLAKQYKIPVADVVRIQTLRNEIIRDEFSHIRSEVASNEIKIIGLIMQKMDISLNELSNLYHKSLRGQAIPEDLEDL